MTGHGRLVWVSPLPQLTCSGIFQEHSGKLEVGETPLQTLNPLRPQEERLFLELEVGAPACRACTQGPKNAFVYSGYCCNIQGPLL